MGDNKNKRKSGDESERSQMLTRAWERNTPPRGEEWDDPIVLQLEELLVSGLHVIFKEAVELIVEHGYSEAEARKCLARQELYTGNDNLMSNLVIATLSALKKENYLPSHEIDVFENLQHMVKYTLLEMVQTIIEVRPSFSVLEALWWLLICDLNIKLACTTEDLDEELLATKTNVISFGEQIQSMWLCKTHGKAEMKFPNIPFDEALGKHIPEDKKAELIVKLVERLNQVQNQSNHWTDWANEKVMQATRKLSNDMPALKALRKEKEELENSKTEAKIMEENTVKRETEMETALNTATEHVMKSESMIGKLESERFALKRQMEAAQTHADLSAASCGKAIEMEKKTAQRLQDLYKEKNVLQEELRNQNKEKAELEVQLSKLEKKFNRVRERCDKERAETERYLAEAAAIRKQRERMEAEARAKEEEIMRKIESEKKTHMMNVKQLENRLALLKYNAECSTRRSEVDEGVKREMECVMCLEEEKSVVFLPCAHQVLCVECNRHHQLQGMNDCPSCRTPIRRRINVILPPSPKTTTTRKPKN